MRGIFFFSQMGRPHKETKGFEVKVARMDYEFNLEIDYNLNLNLLSFEKS